MFKNENKARKSFVKKLMKIVQTSVFVAALFPLKSQAQNVIDIEGSTDHLISILEKTNYFDFVDSRIHGWPENDRSKSYWWGTYWSGVRVFKKNGVVTYQHGPDGADNNGFRTAALMEGVCYRQSLAPDLKWDRLVRKMIRGFSSWILASQQRSHPEYPRILSRAHYTQSVLSTENDRRIYIDFSLNLPGVDNESTQYVEIRDNPTFGRIWVKNSRSRDDLGEMIRAMAQLESCKSKLSLETKNDLEAMRALYSDWAFDVDSNEFEPPSLTKEGIYNRASSTVGDRFAHAFLPAGNLAMRLLHQKDPGEYEFINPFNSVIERLVSKWLRNDAFEIMRAMEVAAVVMSKSRHNDELTRRLMRRLHFRVGNDMDYLFKRRPALHLNPDDVSAVLINAYNAGLDLSYEQRKFLAETIERANNKISIDDKVYRVFASETPDGEYKYDAPDPGMQFRAIGLLLGSCSSVYRAPENPPLLNCQKIRTYLQGLAK